MKDGRDNTETKSMDKVLRRYLIGEVSENTGNRDFSIPRFLLVLMAFQAAFGRVIMKENDKMLFTAKYLWYADMIAKKKLTEA